MSKRFLLALAVVLGFFVGYGATAQAYPSGGVYGRAEHRGYFTNTHDTWGSFVLPAFPSYGGNAFPTDMDTVDEFISFIKFAKLDLDNNGSGNRWEKTGAAFIIQTMIGSSRNRPPTAAQIAEWEARVRYAASQGRISWHYNYSYTLNSFFQGENATAGTNDDAFYDERGTSSAVVFRNAAGQIVYALRRQCANPVGNGNIAPIPDDQNFNMSGRSTVSSTTVKPGQSVQFFHYLRNGGPSSTAPTNISLTLYDGVSGAVLGGPVSSGTYTAGQEKLVSNRTVPVPLNTPVGTRICQEIGWSPDTQSGGSGRSTEACTTVIPDFNLTPTVTVDKTTAGEGDQVTFTYTVTSAGVTPSEPISCKVVGNNRGPGYTPLPQQDVDRNSDPGYTPPSTSCPQVFQPNTPTQVATETITVGGLAPGSRICRSLVINPKNETGGFRASAETCVFIAKTPYSRFMGNDVFAGGGFSAINPACNSQANITTIGKQLSDGSFAGSVGEYNNFALGRITGFGSSSKVLIGSGAIGDAARQLTFANSEPDATRLGYFGAAQHCIEDYIAQFGSSPTLAPGTYNVASRGSGAWHVTGALTLHGPLPQGRQQVYYADGDVTISGNITYANNYNGRDGIPSLLVITRGNIRVQSNVSQMDGIYIARGNGTANGVFYTCWPKVEPASTSNPCNQNQLTVNGAVAAARIDLFRSFGATGATPDARKEPAETFYFSPELYLQNVINASSQTIVETTNVIELPPRF